MNHLIHFFYRACLLIVCFIYSSLIKAYDFQVDGLYYNKLSANQVEVTYKSYKDGSYSGILNIPSIVSYNGVTYNVTSIGDYAFYDCHKLSGSLIIPYSVTSIGDYAFGNCTGFTGNLIISNSVKSIGDYAFYWCYRLKGSLTIPNSVTSIGEYAFDGCSGLTGSLNISDSLTMISRGAFSRCSGLTGTLTIPNSVTIIQPNAFEGCKSFSGSLTIPKSVIKIGTSSFSKCSGINGPLTIPNSVNEINYSAFYQCNCISRVISEITNPYSIDDYVFMGISSSAILQVPKGTKSMYQIYSGWTKHFKEIIESESTSSTNYTLSITTLGNGSVLYDGTTIRNGTGSFTVNEGIEATISFSPDNGYRIKNVEVNGFEVSVSNNQYTIGSINSNTTVSVEFEAIPVTTYTLSITALGNGSASYGGTTIRSKTSSFTVNAGSSAIFIFSPDDGYRIKSVKINNTAVSVSNNQYTISSINANTTVSVEFEAIPVTTYTLSIKASGNGSASYGGTTIRSKTSSFTVNAGSSATITFSPDNGYRIKSVKVNNSTVSVLNGQYTISSINANTTVSVDFETIPVTTYTLSITASGNGSASYSGTTVRNSTKKFTLNEGISATISFNPDNGYQIKSATMNGKEIADLSTMSFTIDIMDEDVSIEVEFEAIPPTTYTLTLKSSGNGSVSYNGTVVRNTTKSFTLNKGISTTISFSSDKGYRIKKATMNGKEIADLSKMSFTIDNVDEDVTIEVEFEAIPPTTYTLSITSSGVGSATYNSTVVRGKTTSFTVNEGTNATISFTPDIGYRIKSVMVNSTDVTSSVSNGQYTVRNIKANTTVEVIFEAIPKTYTLSIKATGNGTASYGGTMIKNETKSFTLTEGVSATITFSPDKDCRIKTATMNGREIADLSTMSFTIDIMDEDVSIEVEFEVIPFYTLKYVVDGETYKEYQVMEGSIITPEAEPTKEGYTFSGWSDIPKTMPAYDVTITGSFTKNKPDINSLDKEFTIDGINYEMVSTDNLTVVVAEGDYGKILEVPANIMYGEYDWDVIGLKDDALDKCEELAAIIWNPLAMFTARVKNPNLLLYVHDQTNASYGVNNVIVNGIAESIELTDATSGNDFYCPRAFRAKKIIYSHNYKMETGLGESKGWETIVLPFDVQNYTHATKGDIEPFTTWTMDSNKKPFWLFELTADGYIDVPGIKANTPYIISMPNNRQYEQQYQISGVVTFSATNVEVKESDDLKSISYQNRKFIPNYTNQKNLDYLPLNVNNNYVTYEGADAGSKFIGGLRSVHPFEAYMITTDGTRSIDVFDGMTTAINDIYMRIESAETMKVYNTKGVLIKTVTTNEDLRRGLPAGVYIVNGKKMIIK